MKVYVVTSDYGYDSKNFECVFSTQEKAQAYIERVYGKNSAIAECTEIKVDEEEI